MPVNSLEGAVVQITADNEIFLVCKGRVLQIWRNRLIDIDSLKGYRPHLEASTIVYKEDWLGTVLKSFVLFDHNIISRICRA